MQEKNPARAEVADSVAQTTPQRSAKTRPGIRTYDLPFLVSEYEHRHARVKEAMETKGVDATIVTMPRDFHWLTGTRVDFWAAESPQWEIIWDGEPVGIVRRLEASTHRCCSFLKNWVEYPDAGPVNPYDPIAYTVQAIKERKLDNKRIGINLRVFTVEEYHWLQEQLPQAQLVDFRVERLRVCRSPLELECIRRAVKVNQDALMDTINQMQVGWSEWGMLKRVSQRHEHYLGDEYFRSAWGSTCCQIGRHMMHMHAIRTPAEMRKQKIKPGDGMWIEPGVFVKEYVGCMIRTVWFGPPPREVRHALDATGEALNRLIAAIAPGKTAGEIDTVARSYLDGQGLDFQHRSGYMSNEKWADGGILSLTPNNPLVLEPGQVFHCPMHVHVPGLGYMGVSEQVLVTDTGCEVLGDRDRTCARQLFVKE